MVYFLVRVTVKTVKATDLENSLSRSQHCVDKLATRHLKFLGSADAAPASPCPSPRVSERQVSSIALLLQTKWPTAIELATVGFL